MSRLDKLLWHNSIQGVRNVIRSRIIVELLSPGIKPGEYIPKCGIFTRLLCYVVM